MKTYIVNIDDLPKIRKLFWGFIFRRTENGIGYVKCSKNQAKIIENSGINLNLKS